ncbi:hypothetical protein EDB84DRAFT_1568479 [Lactarius hengduanensis]|nr:hypothetical protein EDB84DRAFT_1568479 [Lactarius hengduanensis]
MRPEPSRLEPFLPTVPCPSPSVPQKPDLPTVQRLAQSSHVISGLLNAEDVEASVAADAADADLLLGSTDESDRPILPPDRTPSTTDTHNTGGDTTSEPVLLQHSTALQVELAAQPAQMAGQLRLNAQHVSGALAAGEKAGANLDVMKRERVRLRDHRGKALGTTCLRCRASSLLRLRFWSCSFFAIWFRWEPAVGVVVNQLPFPVIEYVCRRFYRLTNARYVVAKRRHLAMTC